ncbi:hypothetical protein CMV_003703 [Castanea mollissima]|uniref:Uncharacterized protein n=1 Tax=Castanea mollissima TaxID=60419 RepID=A0A8J4RZW0_9ROSI|nr:hypothetical protein CMV_003703 [Castanea mollissima]
MDLDLIQIHPGFEARKRSLLRSETEATIVPRNTAGSSRDKNEMEEICPLNENVVERRWKYMRKRVQVPSHQTWFIPCHISIRYITIGAKFGNGEFPSNQISMH